ncbi:MAG: sulfurtransferase [Gammaproteobacteria bacterium]|nr:MAG: sulfurtransferase [Gammaproteobacteria bacterium]
MFVKKFIKNVICFFLFVFIAQVINAGENKSPLIFIESDWLKGEINNSGVLILDIRSRDEYLSGHIPGAIHCSADDFFSDSKKRLRSFSELRVLVSRILRPAEKIVVYDKEGINRIARIFWILESLGFYKKVLILDKGYQQWQQKGLSIEKEERKNRVSNAPLFVDPERYATSFAIRLSVDSKEKLLIDVRDEAEFSGSSGSGRKGHIPGSVSFPLKKIMKDGSYIHDYEFQGISQEELLKKKIYIYGNLIADSALMYLWFRMIGGNVAVYGGGWQEWQSDNKLPVTVGEGRGL